ncbi:MAG: hypothetical protein WBG42_13300 [Cryomorphaceae bacterium]
MESTVPEIYFEEGYSYVFEVKEKSQNTVLVLNGGTPPEFNYLDSVYPAKNVKRQGNAITFSLPPWDGIELISMLPAIMNYDLLMALELKEKKPSIEITGMEKYCSKYALPPSYSSSENDSLNLCIYTPHDAEQLQLFDETMVLCYRNKTEGITNSGKYTLDYWCEPNKYGFVKFLLTLPDKREILIELSNVIIIND